MMNRFAAVTVPLLVAAAIVLGALVLARTRRIGVALPVMLDLLLAAGLLRLSATATWRAIATAAGLIVVRKLLVLGLTAGSGGPSKG